MNVFASLTYQYESLMEDFIAKISIINFTCNTINEKFSMPKKNIYIMHNCLLNYAIHILLFSTLFMNESVQI